jgi:hypothetical protein
MLWFMSAVSRNVLIVYTAAVNGDSYDFRWNISFQRFMFSGPSESSTNGTESCCSSYNNLNDTECGEAVLRSIGSFTGDSKEYCTSSHSS